MNFNSFYTTLHYISIFSAVIPFSVAIFKIKTLNQSLRVLFIYLSVSVITEFASRLLADSYVKGYYVVQNCFTVLEFLLIALIYYYEFSSASLKSLIKYLIWSYASISILAFVLLANFAEPHSLFSTIEACIMIVLSITFFYHLHKRLDIPELNNYYFFWINSAILLYFSTSFILFLFDGYLQQCDKNTFQLLYSLHLLANIAYNTLFSLGIWKFKTK